MQTQFNLFGFDVQVSVSLPRRYLIHFTPVNDIYGEPAAAAYASTRLGAYYKAWSHARFWARHDRQSYVYEIYRCDMDCSERDGEMIRRRIVHQQTVSKVSFFSSKPL